MNKLIAFALLCCTSVHAQSIFSEGTMKWGLRFPSGEIALPAEYDAIWKIYMNDAAYVCGKEGRYGLYTMSDSSFTGCRFDTIYYAPHDYNQTVCLQLNNKLGWMVEYDSSRHHHIVEPAFDEVAFMREDVWQRDALGNHINIWRGVSVRVDSLYGVADYADGSIRLAPRYRKPIHHSRDIEFFACTDPSAATTTVIDPFKGSEFTAHWQSTFYFLPERDLVYAIEYDRLSHANCSVIAWQHSTGREIWRFTSAAEPASFTVYSDQVICIDETVPDVYGNPKFEKHVWTFFNLTTGVQLLRIETEYKQTVDVTNLPDRLVVCVYHKAKLEKRREIFKQ